MKDGEGKDSSKRILSYYSYLFGFPSHGVLLVELLGVTLAGGVLPFLLFRGLNAFHFGVLFGLLSLALPCIVGDMLTALMLGSDVLLTPRRCTALCVTVSVPWVVLLALSGAAARVTGNGALIPRAFMVGSSISVGLRFLALSALTPSTAAKTAFLSAVQPLMGVIAVVTLMFIETEVLLLGLVAGLSSLLGAWLVTGLVRQAHSEDTSFDLLGLFRAFMMAWAAGVAGPLEGYLERFGENADLRLDQLVFSTETSSKGAFLVSRIHSGPFRNTGSSELPVLANEELEKKLGCQVMFLHGVSTHEQDLASQAQSERVLQAIRQTKNSGTSGEHGSQMVRTTRGRATATCQLFGENALLSLTVAPMSFDDLPKAIEHKITEAGASLGLRVSVVDLHNSTDGDYDLSEEDLTNLCEAGAEALRHALEAPGGPIRVGFSRVIPKEFSPKDGMGPAGISACVVEVEGQSSVFATVDGNNMVSGLREELLSALKDEGFDEAEVATTDTHVVNGLSVSPRGYYPIGERVDRAAVTKYLCQAAAEARDALQTARFQYNGVEIGGLRIIGEKGLRLLGEALETGFRRFKATVFYILFPVWIVCSLIVILV